MASNFTNFSFFCSSFPPPLPLVPSSKSCVLFMPALPPLESWLWSKTDLGYCASAGSPGPLLIVSAILTSSLLSLVKGTTVDKPHGYHFFGPPTVIPIHFGFVCTSCVRLVTQSCPTLCDPMDWSSPDSSVHGILQARILEWVAIPFSRGIFLTQGSNQGLLHCRWTLYHLSHQGSPAHILLWS